MLADHVHEVALSQQELRAKVFHIERKMLAMPQVPPEVRHVFSNGIYAREGHLVAGRTYTGGVHKYENLNILSSGELSVMTENGIECLKAPCMIVSPPGTKRIAFAHTDCVWTTILHTNLTDIAEIEAHFIAKDEADYLAFCESLKLEGQ